MFCKQIKIKNFRNIDEAFVEFSPHTNFFSGDNAQGKTNLLEAVYLFSLAKSFRSGSDSELINFNQPGLNPDGTPGGNLRYADLSMIFADRDGDTKLDIQLFDNSKKLIYRNGVKLARYSDLVGIFRTVLFLPSHLDLVTDSPSVRREFLDIAISQTDRNYLRALQDFNKVLKERNRVIKEIGESLRTGKGTPEESTRMLDLYTDMLCEDSLTIIKARFIYLKRLGKVVKKVFDDISYGREASDIQYTNSFPQPLGGLLSEMARDPDLDCRLPSKELLSQTYKKAYERDLAAGSTVFGIHKDDMELLLNGRPVKSYGSQGQKRSFALALKLGEGEIIREETGEYPVYLFDDVLSELDVSRQRYLMEKMEDRQVIITSCEFDVAAKSNPKAFKDSYLYRVLGGKYLYF